MFYDNNLIKRFETLKEQAKQIEKEMSEIKNMFIQSNGGESAEYQVFIKDNTRESVCSKSVFELKFGNDWLKSNDLLTVSNFKTVNVIKKKVG